MRELGLRRWRVQRDPVVLWPVVDDRASRTLMPAAYQAKWWSTMRDLMDGAAKGRCASELAREWASLWTLPAHFAVDFLETSAAISLAWWDLVLGRR